MSISIIIAVSNDVLAISFSGLTPALLRILSHAVSDSISVTCISLK